MQHNRRGGGEWPACYGRRRNEVRVRFYSSLPQRRMARLQRPSPQRPSASDSILRRRKGESLACSGRRRNDLPRPILIFVVAKENGSACSGRRRNGLPHPIIFFVAAKENGPPATAVAATAFRIRITR